LAKETSSQRDYSFYAGCCTWAPNQLETELARGLWIPVHTQADLVVSLSNYAVSEKDRDDGRVQAFSLGRVRETKQEAAKKSSSAVAFHEEEGEDVYSDDFEDDVGDEEQDDDYDDEDDLYSDYVSPHNAQQQQQQQQQTVRIQSPVPTTLTVVKEEEEGTLPSKSAMDAQQEAAAVELTNLRAPLLTRERSGLPFRVDVYQFALRSLGPAFEGLADLARSPSVSVGSVESSDWK
jgi:hypothetical protein